VAQNLCAPKSVPKVVKCEQRPASGGHGLASRGRPRGKESLRYNPGSGQRTLMSHPDDLALPADPKTIDILIDAAAPEKAQTWRDLRERYQVTMHPVADRKGVTLRAHRRRIEFDNKTMTWLWLLGFAGWRAFRLHGPHLLWRVMTGTPINGQLRAEDPTFAETEGDYGAVLYAVRDFPKLDTMNEDGFWPDGVDQHGSRCWDAIRPIRPATEIAGSVWMH
jgi:hypothetical protein